MMKKLVVLKIKVKVCLELVESYNNTNQLLKNITEKKDVNEQYIFDLIDAWAKERGVKTKK